MGKTIQCPSCGAYIPLAVIPNEDLQSERGRRNAARRRNPGSDRGIIRVWNKHIRNRICQCADCLIAKVRRRNASVAQYEARYRSLGQESHIDSRRKDAEDYESRVRNALERKGIVVETF